ncbi:MAG: hypothetical protein JNL67_08700 [Planctomycetaceae bacterium]|nr:hypothetical protein [Planctomycetaceae bacterium]
MTRSLRFLSVAIILFGCIVSQATAQDIFSENMAFDARMNAQLQGMQTQLAQQQAAFWQSVLQNPEVRSAFQQHRAQGGQSTYEQFAYWYVMTAGGTNYQAAADAQRQQFAGWQQANQTIQQGHNSYNQGHWQNQQRQSAAMQRYSDGAIRGQWYYQDPYQGTVHTLPYGQGSGFYHNNVDSFFTDSIGQYYRATGHGWQALELLNR